MSDSFKRRNQEGVMSQRYTLNKYTIKLIKLCFMRVKYFE